MQVVRNLDGFDDSQIVFWLHGHHGGLRFKAIGKCDHEFFGALHHMQVGEDHALFTDDHARTHTILFFFTLGVFGVV